MKCYRGDGLGDMYAELLRDVTTQGRRITVRGQSCQEFPEPVTLVYDKPGACFMNIPGPGRRWNPFLALAEVVWILTGNGNVDWIAYFSDNIRAIAADEGKAEFHGAYGLRLRRWQYYGQSLEHGFGDDELDQIQHVVQKLKADPFSRQAVMSLWDPVRDNLDVSKDYPCNNLVYYSLRHGHLHQTVVQRSNDLVYGTPYNAVQFSHLHALVAGELGVKIGTLTYVIQNLHYYFDLYPKILAPLLQWAFGVVDQVGPVFVDNGALAPTKFRTVTDESIKRVSASVECIRSAFRLDTNLLIKHHHQKKNLDVLLNGSGYWEFVIPAMIFVFTAVKEQSEKDTLNEDLLNGVAATLVLVGEPLISLARDFYFNSRNSFAQALVTKLDEQYFQRVNRKVETI